jgi:hypothetical protein
MDITPTFYEVSKVIYPQEYNGNRMYPFKVKGKLNI